PILIEISFLSLLVRGPPEPYTLSLHDALPILLQEQEWSTGRVVVEGGEVEYPVGIGSIIRSEPAEHRDVYASLQEIATHRPGEEDRKSTRLNSSHQIISYAVFCLKNKRPNTQK